MSEPQRVFVGREHESSELLSGLDEALSGRGRLFLVSGEAGIGKTRLAVEFADRAISRGSTAFWGRCREGGAAPAFWPWIQLLRGIARQAVAEDFGAGPGAGYLARLVPGIAPALASQAIPPDAASLESEHARFYLFDAVGGFLRSVSLRQPLVLILDDLHWADSSSLLLLRFLAAELNDSRIVLVAIYREAEARRAREIADHLGDLARAATRLALEGLDARSVTTLIAHATGVSPPSGFVNKIHRITQGNPFFVDELARLLAAEHRLADSRALQSSGLKIPEGVRQLVQRRLTGLSEACREALTVAAVIGREFQPGVLAEVCEIPREALAASLTEAALGDVVEEDPEHNGGYRFTQAMIRETLYRELPHARRLQLHGRIAEAIEQFPATKVESHVTELAFHFSRSAPFGVPQKAIHYAVRAGRGAAERLAYDEAANYFQTALQGIDLLSEPDEALRCDLLLELGESQRRSGSVSAAAASFERAADLAKKLGSPERFARAALRWGAAHGPLLESYTSSGRVDHGVVAVLAEALALLPPEDGALRARLLGRLAAVLYWDPQSIERRKSLSAEAVAMARRLGDPVGIASALNSKRFAFWGPDDLDERLADANEAIRLAELGGDRERGLQSRQWRIGDLLEVGDIYGADIEIDVYERIAQSLRQPFYLGHVAMFRAMRAFLRGRFSEGEALANEALRLGESAQNPMATVLHGAQLFRASWEQGKIEILEASLAGIRAETDILATRCALAFVLCELGRFDEARDELSRLAEDDFARIERDVGWLAAMSLLARVCATLGDQPRAERLHALLLPYARRNVLVGPPVADCLGPVAYYLGLLAATLGRNDEATRHFESALRASAAMGALPAAARVWLSYAEVLIQRGERERAGELLRQSLDAARALGMKRLAERVSALLEDTVAAGGGVAEAASLHRNGDFWMFAYQGRTCRLKDALGFHYLAHLLRHPRAEFHVMDVASQSSRNADSVDSEGVPDGDQFDRSSLELGHAGEVLDARARTDYQKRLEDLRPELESARQRGDEAHVTPLEEEINFLTKELSSAYGLGGRARKGVDVAERVRKAVTNRIRDAIVRVQGEHPALGMHLQISIQMGVFCSYVPDRNVSWSL